MKSALKIPALYRLLHAGFGTSRMRRHYIEQFVRPRQGETVVDIGCGPADVLEFFPPVKFVGLDYNAKYIAHARKRWPEAEFFTAAVDLSLANRLPPADVVMATALIHHLTDDEARNLFQVARAILKPGGRLLTLDNHFRPAQNPISRWLIQNDRGRFARTSAGYAALADPLFRVKRSFESDRLLRVPYDIVIFEFASTQDGRTQGGT